MLLLILLCADSCLACRYSVRDTGFVDLGDSPYRVILRVPDPSYPVNHLGEWATSIFRDSNVSWETSKGSTSTTTAHLSMLDPTGRTLDLGKWDSIPKDRTTFVKLVEPILNSPLRERLLTLTTDAFAVVILLESNDVSLNQQVHAMVDSAIRQVERAMPSMPKPIKIPPAKFPVPISVKKSEIVALWGLGFDVSMESDCQVALIMGRGRRIGGVLMGPLITRTAVEQSLNVVGQDCECELERSWMQGPVVPSRWDSARHFEVAKKLGFDPENPLIRAEVTRIVQRGGAKLQNRKLAKDSSRLGYQEVSIDPSEGTESVVDASILMDSGAVGGDSGLGKQDANTPSNISQKRRNNSIWAWIGLGVIGCVLGVLVKEGIEVWRERE